MTLRLYLCGSVAGRSVKDMREERLHAADQIRACGMVPIDPIAGEYEALKGRRVIQDDQSPLTPANIVCKDRYLIDGCDLLLWLTAGISSYGSCIEIGYAWANDIPIIAVDAGGRGRCSAFVAHISTYIADELEGALEWVARYLMVPELEGDDSA